MNDSAGEVAERTARQASRVNVEDLVEATTKGVMRALEARRPGTDIGTDRPWPWGPILWGIIWWPDQPGGPVVLPSPQGPQPPQQPGTRPTRSG